MPSRLKALMASWFQPATPAAIRERVRLEAAELRDSHARAAVYHSQMRETYAAIAKATRPVGAGQGDSQ